MRMAARARAASCDKFERLACALAPWRAPSPRAACEQLLPMQLARSFAVRTESELLRYLANAQFLGLAGLWQKLCAGQLPARCDKAWYFATFCGIELAEFERRALGVLDERADILGYLNGFIKPYDGAPLRAVMRRSRAARAPLASLRPRALTRNCAIVRRVAPRRAAQ